MNFCRMPYLLGLCSVLLALSGCARTMVYPATSPGPQISNSEPAPLPTSPGRAGPPRSSTSGQIDTAAPSPSGARTAASTGITSEEARELVSYASNLVGKNRIVANGESFRKDCSGFVRACYFTQDVDLFDVSVGGRSGTESIYLYLRENGSMYTRGKLQPGDVVFFHNTYDRNRNGRRDDLFSHVAIVETVDAMETATLIHVLSGGIVRSRMNIRLKGTHKDANSGKVVNDYLRRADKRHGPTLASDLFVSFGRLF